MLRGLYTAASGMYAQQRKTDILTNNLANIHTPGFKEDQTTIRAFPEMLLHHIESSQNGQKMKRPIGSINPGAYLQETLPRFVQGDLHETGQSTDLALIDTDAGTAFFTVQTDEGLKYTRNGSFTLDAEGLLTTANGWPVLDVAGEEIRLIGEEFFVDQQGVIREAGEEVAQIAVAVAENPEMLMKEGNGLYGTENDEPIQLGAIDDYQISQGYIERANVDATRAMTEMLTAYRAFEANQKVLQAYDRSMDKVVNEVGRVNG